MQTERHWKKVSLHFRVALLPPKTLPSDVTSVPWEPTASDAQVVLNVRAIQLARYTIAATSRADSASVAKRASMAGSATSASQAFGASQTAE